MLPPLTSLPFAADYHTPIMVREVISWLQPSPEQVILDGTLGGGGHTMALLTASSPTGRVIALDRDPEALAYARQRLASFGERFSPVQANYAQAPEVLADLGLDGVDALLIDAGVSSHQLDDHARGFSFMRPGPLDMRMGPDARSLAQLLTELSFDALADLLRHYGEVPSPGKVAAAILEDFHAHKLDTTADLSDAVLRALGRPRQVKGKKTIHPATLVFQALRIAVNDELTHLSQLIQALPSLLRPSGRAAFISFHSLEDRIVKQGLRRHEHPCICPPGLPVCSCGKLPTLRALTSKPVRPAQDEIDLNPRARSAVLRVAQRL